MRGVFPRDRVIAQRGEGRQRAAAPGTLNASARNDSSSGADPNLSFDQRKTQQLPSTAFGWLTSSSGPKKGLTVGVTNALGASFAAK